MTKFFNARVSLPMSPRGFSLIELLVAIIILGLGLLGLAALFPVVIREQRIGTDNVLGVTVSNSARATLTGTRWEVACERWAASDPYRLPSVWELLRVSNRGLSQGARVTNGSPPAGPGQRYELGEWWLPEITSGVGQWPLGTTIVGDPQSTDRQSGVPLAARLHPSEGEPQFVWDFALQRISDFDYNTGPLSDRMRAVVFVRRIDPRIRTGNRTLREVLLDPSGTLPLADQRVPVGADAMNLPTLDGTDGNNGARYATPMIATMLEHFRVRTQPNSQEFPVLTDVDITEPVGRLMAQLGQKLVDNLGNIYTVVEVARPQGAAEGMVDLRITPAIPLWAMRQPEGASGQTNLRQLIFTPQVPAAVVLTEIDP